MKNLSNSLILLKRLLYGRIIALAGKNNRRFSENLNQKILAFIQQNSHRQLPKREELLSPEILIPCYNHGKYLRWNLLPLENVSVPITIIDDHSTDNSPEIISELSKFFQFKMIKNKINLGQHGSINKAINNSSNNLFIIINADDILIPNWINYVIDIFNNSDIFLMGGGSIHFSAIDKVNIYLSMMISSMKYMPNEKIIFYGPEKAKTIQQDNDINMTMSGCAFLKSAWDFVGGFKPLENRVSRYDDRDFQIRVCCFFKIGISDEISAFYRTDSSQGRGTI